MPEKPEVLTVVKSLKPMLLNKTITECNVYWENIIASPSTDLFKKKIIGEKINDITTRGKFIVMELDKYYLLVHLRMEGKFMFRKKGEEIGKHEHVELILNIYDDEILFMSSINPNRKACDVTLEECGKIIDNCREVLTKAIKLGGTTIKSFTSSEGVHGLFQNELLAHGKAGSPCPRCGSILVKIKIGGRGTHYCCECQK